MTKYWHVSYVFIITALVKLPWLSSVQVYLILVMLNWILLKLISFVYYSLLVSTVSILKNRFIYVRV